MSSSKNNTIYKKTSFLAGNNSEFINEFYADYISDPNSLPESWKKFFDGLSENEKLILNDINGPSWSPGKKIKKIDFGQIDENIKEDVSDLSEIESKILKILDEKIRPAVAKDGGDIKFKEFKDGVVKVQLQGSCSGCPSSTMTLKQGVHNLLCHYLPEVKEVVAIQ